MIWIGQLASLLGSEMTNFALTIWAWEVTEQATPLSLILFFTQTPRIIAALFAGVLVDRMNRKKLMILGDLIAGFSTIAILILYLTKNLQIWHLYLSAAVNGLFGYLQTLAYSASLSLIVPKQHYSRATALNGIQMSGSYILAPALAGFFYTLMGLAGILAIDIFTFIIAISTLIFINIPQPKNNEVRHRNIKSQWQELTFGFRYLFRYPPLIAILIFWLGNNLIDGMNFAILTAMILARSNNDSTILSTLLTTFGIGGLLGGVTISIWGGSKRKIHGLLTGSAIWKLGLLTLSLALEIRFKMIAAFVSGFSSPFPSSSNQAIWLSKVEPDIQGRVFAARFLIAQIPTSLGAAIAGLLADHFFEPAMKTGGILAPIFGNIFGTQTGAGMALMISILSICGALIAFFGYAFPLLRDVEKTIPDWNVK
ncbi:major facilitator superfamily transporter [Calothrix parasitica NIES-267]|uniref:Major facilitator superfamily transporter n=1 Tax=Calothrix parasitica NIES-267 TaxID=1973488 RepID=A0A1Z4LY48_9CYAN|nr:major facilitator superfamily transporter [Calothrix parasitica NIES-267]